MSLHRHCLDVMREVCVRAWCLFDIDQSVETRVLLIHVKMDYLSMAEHLASCYVNKC